MRSIPLTQGLFAVVDDTDFNYLSQFSWQAVKPYNIWYARRHIPGTRKKIYMHRDITKVSEDVLVDHRDGNGLNNTRENLRACTPLQNSTSFRRKRKGASSKYRGVCWRKQRQAWEARIGPLKKRLSLGYFEEEEAAARAYDTKAKELYGEFAQLNFTK